MHVINVRELVSAAIHGTALIAVIPAVVILYRRADPLQAKRWPIFVYGLGLVTCFTASTVSHALTSLGRRSATADMIDHIGIFLLIAGTYTPIAALLLPGGRRTGTLVTVWAVAAVGIALNLFVGPMPAWLATSFYLAMGWGGIWCYLSLRPAYSHRQLAGMPIGGLLYSVGAMFHLARWPVLWEGGFGGHELFHVFVVAGASAHFLFTWRHMPTAQGNIVATHRHRHEPCPQAAMGLDAQRSH